MGTNPTLTFSSHKRQMGKPPALQPCSSHDSISSKMRTDERIAACRPLRWSSRLKSLKVFKLVFGTPGSAMGFLEGSARGSVSLRQIAASKPAYVAYFFFDF